MVMVQLARYLFVCLFVCVFARQLSNKMIFNLDIWFYGPPWPYPGYIRVTVVDIEVVEAWYYTGWQIFWKWQ